jgi:hypothetical protein
MKNSDRRHADVGSLLDPTGAGALRIAVERLRGSGLSSAEAGAEMVRQNFMDWLDSESDRDSGAALRLRIVKR